MKAYQSSAMLQPKQARPVDRQKRLAAAAQNAVAQLECGCDGRCIGPCVLGNCLGTCVSI